MKFHCGDGPTTKKTLTVLDCLFIFCLNVSVGLVPLNPSCSLQRRSGKQEGSPKTALRLKYGYTLTTTVAQKS